MKYDCEYKLTFPSNANPPGRSEEIADYIHAWFKMNAVKYGMGSLGGMRRVYGTIIAESEEEIGKIQLSFANWLRTLAMRCEVQLGQAGLISDTAPFSRRDWAMEYSIDSLTDQDRIVVDSSMRTT